MAKNNKFKYAFEDDYNFYYTDKIIYKYFEYTADDSEPRMIGTVKVIAVEITSTMIFNEEDLVIEALYQVYFAVNCSEKKHLINFVRRSDLINKLGFTIVAKREPPMEPKFQGFEVLLDNVKTKNNEEV